MQIIAGTRHHDRPKFRTMRDLLKDCVARFGSRDAYRYHEKPGAADLVRSYSQFAEDIDACGTALVNLDLGGKPVVVVGANCYEWAVAHNSIINGTGISVPLDRQLPAREVIHLSERSRAEAFFYNGPHHEIALAVAGRNKHIRYFICMKDGIVQPELREADPRFLSWDVLMRQGCSLLEQGDRRFLDAAIDPEALCTLLFTSGTTAMAKGVMLCHRNIAGNVHAVISTMDIQPHQRFLSILPLHHTFENTVGMYVMLSFGSCICFSDGLRYLTQNIKEWQINVILGVPLLFEIIYQQIEKKLRTTNRLLLIKVLRKMSNGLRRIGLDVRRRLFRQILDAIGSGVNLCVSGAAPIDRQIVAFFNEIGIDFFNGYGLTETAPVISTCNYFVNVYGSVGNPLAFVEVAIDTEDSHPGAQGEILTRSECVMLGYYDNPTATAEVMTDDGWFRTGDIGFIDKKGCIHITGRVKSMIVLVNGKKVFPEEVEYLIEQIPGIREAFVWGDTTAQKQVEVCAKCVIDPRQMPQNQAGDQAAIKDWLEEQIRLVNQDMPSYKAIQYFVISEQELIKTTTLEIRRSLEQERIMHKLAELGLTMKTAHGQKIE